MELREALVDNQQEPMDRRELFRQEHSHNQQAVLGPLEHSRHYPQQQRLQLLEVPPGHTHLQPHRGKQLNPPPHGVILSTSLKQPGKLLLVRPHGVGKVGVHLPPQFQLLLDHLLALSLKLVVKEQWSLNPHLQLHQIKGMFSFSL